MQKIRIGRPIQIRRPTTSPQRKKIIVPKNRIQSIKIQSPKSPAISTGRAQGTAPTSTEAEQEIFEQTNKLRADYEKPPLEYHDRLTELARHYSRLMLEKNFFAHVTPEGKNLMGRSREFQIQYHAIAENIACYRGHFVKPPGREVAVSWFHSPGHRANMLDENNLGFTHLGVGMASKFSSSENIYYYTQLFLLPLHVDK